MGPSSGRAPIGDTVADVACGCKSGVLEKAKWLGEYIIDVGGEVCCVGDGTKFEGRE
jgi:hypothetical protein